MRKQSRKTHTTKSSILQRVFEEQMNKHKDLIKTTADSCVNSVDITAHVSP